MSIGKILWLADDWSESEVENKSEQEDHDDKGNQSDRAEKSTPEMKIAEIDTLVSERYVCCNEKTLRCDCGIEHRDNSAPSL